jgi:predicted O-linked N-acetylglucosamine transferase (SPINDLY family)
LTLSLPTLRIPDRLRIGYISADFNEHPLSYLLIRTLELHNRDHFKIYAYSCHGEDSGKMRERIKNAVDVFVDIKKMSNHDAVKRIQKDEIDILIDLTGYTKGGRTDIFQYRPAPIQINYIGYPGTMGADFIDYLMADRTLIPDQMQQYYREKIIYLPNCYQPNDNTRVISDKVLTKSEMGLPDDGFVFCCFNKSYKITSTEFDIWMRLIAKVDKSVLWLLSSNKWAEKNLKEAASIRGISSDRIVFAQKIPHADHLARLKLADLFLDTFNYNAGATATDALWSGLPLITKMGQGYTARMAGSILSAIGLSELIVTEESQYEKLALRLATAPGELIQIRKKLAANRLATPLFDTELSTKHLENGYSQAYKLYFEGKSPDHIYVSE